VNRSRPAGEPYVGVWRGALVESVHDVALCAADSRGMVVYAVGDIDVPVYVRSAAKPFIAATIVASGTAGRFAFGAKELAIISASHNAEPLHLAAVRGILAKIGLDVDALRCGTENDAGSALYNNCSGKHAGILALCVHRGYDVKTYLEPEHPAEREILAFCGRMVGLAGDELPIAVDGCGIPVFAASLRRVARAFARFATLEDVVDPDAEALRAVRDAMAAEPWYVGGTGRFDTALIAVTGGRVVGKAGAEGLHADGLSRDGLGLALKVVDGARRAVPPAVMGTLRRLGALDERERAALASFAEPEVRNVAGRVVGRIASLAPPER